MQSLCMSRLVQGRKVIQIAERLGDIWYLTLRHHYLGTEFVRSYPKIIYDNEPVPTEIWNGLGESEYEARVIENALNLMINPSP